MTRPSTIPTEPPARPRKHTDREIVLDHLREATRSAEESRLRALDYLERIRRQRS